MYQHTAVETDSLTISWKGSKNKNSDCTYIAVGILSNKTMGLD